MLIAYAFACAHEAPLSAPPGQNEDAGLEAPLSAFDACQALLSTHEPSSSQGCPPCPCACDAAGNLNCAPCAACEGFLDDVPAPDVTAPE